MVDIADLDPSVPTNQDLVSRGDDEIVRVKQALNTDFGGINGPVYEDADTDGLGGSTLLSAAKMSSWEARHVDADARLNALETAPPDFIVGQIILWYGTVASIPAGWALCDGTVQNTVQTPDLRSRFVLGAGGLSNPGEIGGASTGTTDSKGAHSHGGAAGDHALTAAQLPDLDNNLYIQSDAVANNQGDAHFQSSHVAGGRSVATQAEQAPVTTQGLNGQAHNHSIGSDGAHAHDVATVPPYHALAYIIYVGVP